MLQTLFTIPDHVGGLPLFGFGLLLAVWAVGSLVLLASLVRRQGFNADTLSYLPLIVLIGAMVVWILPSLAEEQHGLPIRGYGVMLFLGVTCGTALSVWRGYRLGLDPDMVMTLVFWGIVPGIIGARTYYVIEYWDEFWTPGEPLLQTLGGIINITKGGLVVYGSLIGGLAGFVVFILKKKLPLWATLDLVAPGMLLGLALGRIGCLMNGCCFGGECELPWAVTFPIGSPAYVRQAQDEKIFIHGLQVIGPRGAPAIIHAVEPGSAAEQQGLRPGERIRSINGIPISTVEAAQRLLIEAHEPGTELEVLTASSPHPARWTITPPLGRSLPIHPTQVYEAISALLLCLLLLAYDPFARRDGQVFALLLTLYPVCRFLLECIRTDEPGVLGTPLHTGQVVSLLALVAAAGLWALVLRRPPARALLAQTAAAA
jgi:phosphatidylglycerol---prolipoprotein diacylglyceryl transferase